MNQTLIFACLAATALVHASFQLSVSMLTLLSGHTLGKKASYTRLLHLSSGFIVGVGIITPLLVSSLTYAAIILQNYFPASVLWAVTCGLCIGTGFGVWLFYYRRSSGTALWLPRPMARYLNERTRVTNLTGEAFGLGVSSVLAEIIFILAPLCVSGLLISRLDPMTAVAAIIIYVVIALLPLLIIGMLLNGGHKISQIQKWRENNKRFLQFSAGSALLVLGFFLYVSFVVAESSRLAGVAGL